MDPLTAAGLASSIISFVSFTTQVISRCEKLYRSASGALAENLELENLATNIRRLAEETRCTKEDEILESLSSQCMSVSDELIALLNSVKVKSDRHGWASIHQAVKSVWKQSDIDDIQQRLNRIQTLLHNRLVTHQQREIDYKLERLIEENERLDLNRTKELETLRNQITSALHDIINDVQQEGQKTRAWSALYAGAQKEKVYSTEQLLLNSLVFRLIDYRLRAIPKEHARTFAWVFEPDTKCDQTLPPANFVNWLRHDYGLYWISGKPGSGKSTLMKFLAGHEQTQEHLKTWSGGNKLVLASFYFWSAAKNSLQKSQTGLLRSILYQILRQCPELIRVAFPDQWSQSISSVTGLAETPFSNAELLEAFDKVTTALETYQIRFCFFIDGLDEFEGRPADIVQLVEYLGSSPSIKACVSSRPWNEFESSFGKHNPWKLYIHDLTREDIRIYVEDRLGKHERFRELQVSDDNCPNFVKSVVDTAQGVFLWVFLVVNSLLDGLTNADTVSHLRERLLEFPQSLDEYFQKALMTVEERYRPQMARALAVTLEADEILPLMCYWFLDREEPDYALNLELGRLSRETISTQMKITRTRLNAYCRGLLEVQYPTDTKDIVTNMFVSLLDCHVDFLHRTVRDFLWTPGMQALLCTWLPRGFDLNLDICKAILALIKLSVPILVQETHSHLLARFVKIFFHHIAGLDGDTAYESTQFALLDDVATILQVYIEFRHRRDKDLDHDVDVVLELGHSPHHQALNGEVAVLGRSIQAGLARYTEHTLKKHPRLLLENSELLLGKALFSAANCKSDGLLAPDTAMLQLLLRNGADPNTPASINTWARYLDHLKWKQNHGISKKNINNHYPAVLMFLDYGADPDARCEDERTAVMILQEIFSPAQYACLQKVIEDKRLKNGNGTVFQENQEGTRKQQAKLKDPGKLHVVRSTFRELSPFRSRRKSLVHR
ncbi:uncharacterized protein AKAW2_70164A [Aspergillus luchuensis]|uniref:Uncharacterized protein n=1 Tax=Aspergillus kawachii TaxID=1069201 RepID=A0A7R7WHW5_ASPKA|nr:uncharacterized protein AKAW2_70164A [Aspergillus luchuensis]BCS03286.1 hypothetical protein AKAW2_70164A [Aspergillus luchuensis]BCS14917.1 hypothetical protein ALUC_70150A [Aspergillus luchuensis]GAA84819.1 hypothetical protein AKAW_02933 [Aspergillus luchuensis IFO 4308]